MAEVRLRFGSGAGGLGITTPYVFLRLASSKKRLDVSAVTRAIHSYSILSRRRMNISRSYRSTSAEDVPLHRSTSAYYDILQVAPNATQAQIKTAYYKQSFIYHPDKNTSSEHAGSLFSQINEAYHVLGNKTLRKKYDAGILSQADVRGSSRPTVTKEKTRGSSSDATKHRRSPEFVARSHNVFDFDAFYRAHYVEQLQRQKQIQARVLEIQRQKEEQFQDKKLGRISEVAVSIMLAAAAAILFSLKSL